MKRIAFALALTAVAGCQTAGTTPAPVATLSYGGEDYPVIETASGWAVRVDGRPIPCRMATRDDCYWSLRHHLNSQMEPELAGS